MNTEGTDLAESRTDGRLDDKTCEDLLDLVQTLQCPDLCLHVGFDKLHEPYHFWYDGETNSRGINRRTESTNQPEPPETVENDGDMAGKLVFAAASLLKPVMCLLVIVLIHKECFEDLSLDADAFELLNKYRVKNRKKMVPVLDPGRTIRQLLLHDQGFPRMTEFLLSPGGMFMVSEQQFLDRAALIANEEAPRSDARAYSTCNYILVGLLLKEMFGGKSLESILREHLFNHLEMNRTTIDPDTVNRLIQQGIVLDGHSVAGDFTSSENLGYQPHVTSEISMMAFGFRTCVDDMANMLQALLDAEKGGSYLTSEMADDFFQKKQIKPQRKTRLQRRVVDSTKPQTTFVGLGGVLNSSMPGSQSLNSLARTKPEEPSFSLGEMMPGEQREEQRSENFFHYKAGMIDGFTSCLYVSRQLRIFVIAFANAVGPLESADYACQIALQRIIPLDPQVDPWTEMIKLDKPSAQKIWEEVDQHHRQIPDLTDDIVDYAGKYQAALSGQWFEVTKDGKWIIVSPDGLKETMEARVIPEGLEIYPSAQSPFGIDRMTTFRRLIFAEVPVKGGIGLKSTTSDGTEILYLRSQG